MASASTSPRSTSSASSTQTTSSITSITSLSSSLTTSSPNFSTSPSSPPSETSRSNQQPNGAASASLYLYTFLATLVLLLSVSAAIILRSLLLRRRHQRMVEEAIRNGTWVPPSPGGSGNFPFGANGRRVDLSKKPRMWEAYMGSREHQHHHAQSIGAAEAVTEWEWDTIRPFAATYVNPPVTNDAAPVISTTTEPAVRPSLSDRVRGLLNRSRRTPADASTPTEQPMTTIATSTPATAAPILDGGSSLSPTPSTSSSQKVRVAVLIAMPQPPEAKSRSSSPQPVASTSAAVIPPRLYSDDDDSELPHIEFGVAELDVSGPPLQSNRAKDVRSSVASGSSFV